MTLSALCIRRPIMTTLVMLAILIFGIVGYRLLPVSDLPNVDYPTITVRRACRGHARDDGLDRGDAPRAAVLDIAGVDAMTSSNSLGSTQITLQFNLSRDIDAAAQDVQSAVASALGGSRPTCPVPLRIAR